MIMMMSKSYFIFLCNTETKTSAPFSLLEIRVATLAGQPRAKTANAIDVFKFLIAACAISHVCSILTESSKAPCFHCIKEQVAFPWSDYSCGCPTPGGAHGQVGWGPGQPGLVIGNQCMARGWSSMIFEVPSNPSHSVIL